MAKTFLLKTKIYFFYYPPANFLIALNKTATTS